MNTFQLREITLLVSKITLRKNKLMKPYFFESINLDSGEQLQAFTITGIDTKNEAKTYLEDMEHIFINEESSEPTFVVARNKFVMNKWYKQRWEGKVSKLVCEKFNYFNQPTDDEEVQKYREIIKKSIPLIQI